MGTRMRFGIWVGLTVVLSFLAWGLGPLLLVDGGAGPELDEPVAVVDGGEDVPLKEKAAGITDAEMVRENEEFLALMEEQAALADEAQESRAVAQSNVAEVAEAEPEASGEVVQSGGGMPRWQSIWADLNLSPQEEARFREGFDLAIAKFLNMSPEDQAAERARLQGMRQRWDAMSDQEREAASGRIRDRFEDWRANGGIELPKLSLD